MRKTAMKIAQIAPLMESIPPRLYGGSERVVSYLTEELVAQGHDVTLFASGQSITAAKLVPCCAQPLRLNSAVQRRHPLLHADARQGSQHGVRVRHPAFPHRPVPLPDLPRDGAPDGHHPARPPGSARPPPSLSRLSRHAAGLDLERAARADPRRELRRHRLSRPAARLSRRRSSRAAAIWRFSAASRRRSASTAPSRSPAPSACR